MFATNRTRSLLAALTGLLVLPGLAMAGDKKKKKDKDHEVEYTTADGVEHEVEVDVDRTEVEVEHEREAATWEDDLEVETKKDGRVEIEYEFEGKRPQVVTVLMQNFDQVHFAFDKSDLNRKSRNVLNKNARLLKENPDLMVRIEGHTDEVGSKAYNRDLGMDRATAVRDYLVSKGVDRSQLRAVSRGESDPQVDVGEKRARANRRVEFEIGRKG